MLILSRLPLNDLSIPKDTTKAKFSGGSRPGHKVSETRSKFPNLNENGQKCHFFVRFFLKQNPVRILSRSATEILQIFQ